MSKEKYVVIGDGIAGATAAETLRDTDEDAEIHVFTDDSEPLYNRIMLKTYMKGRLPKQYASVHDEGWYEDRDIELHLETPVVNVDTEEKKVETEENEHSYDKLLVATGGSPRRLPFDEGYDNIKYMWTMGDAEKVKKSAEEAEKAVVIGGGLLGIDLAIAYAENDTDVKYLIRGSNWWSRGLDEEGAEIIHKRLEKKGVDVVTNVECIDFKGDEEVEKVVTDTGKEFDCDAVGVAIGQEPNSDIINVEKTDSGMLKVNEHLRTSEKDVYAAGNKVEYYSPVFERRTVNGAWDHSQEMGETAAQNMLGADFSEKKSCSEQQSQKDWCGEEEEFDYVNTYGVGHFDAQFLAVGDWTGEPVSRKYDADHYRRLFFDGDRIVGAVMIGFTRGQEELRRMIAEKQEFEDKEKLLDKQFWQK